MYCERGLGDYYAGLGVPIGYVAPGSGGPNLLQDARFAATFWSPTMVRPPIVTQANLESVAESLGVQLGTPATAATEMIVAAQVPYEVPGAGTVYAAPFPGVTPATPPTSPTGAVPPPPPEPLEPAAPMGPIGQGPSVSPTYTTLLPAAPGGGGGGPVSVSVDRGPAMAGVGGFGAKEAMIAAGLVALAAVAFSKKPRR